MLFEGLSRAVRSALYVSRLALCKPVIPGHSISVASRRQAVATVTVNSAYVEASGLNFVTTVTTKPKVIIVTGPTAVGKTAVGLELATQLGGEIISADSVQVYRSLDIGSDKLPVSQRQGVPHHLIDVKEPVDEFSAGEFYELARAAAEDILQRGRVPIVVGGTGLYLKWFVFGRAQTPKATPETLAHVNAAVKQAWAGAEEKEGNRPATEDEKWLAASELLRTWGDNESYERIVKERLNYYRLERALCIVHQTGRRLREMDIDVSSAAPLEYDCRCFFLHRGRLQLWERIATRIEEMVFGGLLDEAALLLHLDLAPGVNMASRAIGYRQAMEFLLAAAKQDRPVAGPDVVQLVNDCCFATHRLVRSQMTWFRDDASFKWVDISDGDALVAVSTIMTEISKPAHEGGCGDSGRLSKDEQKALMRHRPTLKMTSQAAPLATLLQHLNGSLVPSVRAWLQRQEAERDLGEQLQKKQKETNRVGRPEDTGLAQRLCKNLQEGERDEAEEDASGGRRVSNAQQCGEVSSGSEGVGRGATEAVLLASSDLETGKQEISTLGSGTKASTGTAALVQADQGMEGIRERVSTQHT